MRRRRVCERMRIPPKNGVNNTGIYLFSGINHRGLYDGAYITQIGALYQSAEKFSSLFLLFRVFRPQFGPLPATLSSPSPLR